MQMTTEPNTTTELATDATWPVPTPERDWAEFEKMTLRLQIATESRPDWTAQETVIPCDAVVNIARQAFEAGFNAGRRKEQ